MAAGRGGSADGSRTRTRRIVVLLALAVVCALAIAPPLRLYVQQQQDIAALRGDIEQRQSDVAALETEVDLWREDAYVAAQARERLNFVMPGEIGYVVPDPEQSADTGTDSSLGDEQLREDAAGLLRPAAPPEGTWYDRLWASVEAAGAGAADPVLDAPVVGGGGSGGG